MAEAFLQVVIDNLSSLVQEEVGLILGVDEEVKKLSSTLTAIQAVLQDAKDKQIESSSIRDWLRKVNALAYEIDDILDDCNTHVSSSTTATSRSTLSRYSLKKIPHRHKIGTRMKQVTERLDSVAAERSRFHLRERPLPEDRPSGAGIGAASRETGSLLSKPDKVFGRDEDRDMIVRMLVKDVRKKQDISVLPIVGVGGLGKTTLARLVFNDRKVAEHFDLRIWVCVSDNFEVKSLVKAIIESATGSSKASGLLHLDALERRMSELLSQKRYLLVLDDVWNDQQEKWFELKNILSSGRAGTSIIVTTRQKKVADIMRTIPPHRLEGLSDEHCWMLLRESAFGPEEEEEEELTTELETIGKQIVKKCSGVPLAAKALGGILRFKRREEEWIYVRESEIWKLSAEDSLIMPALRLSYHHLPLELRQCFAYFAAFPKDHQIQIGELILLWMAHGFISSKGTLQPEEVAIGICDELILRSLLQPTLNGMISMHDLVHDLAQSVMENKVPGVQVVRNISSAVSTIRQVSLPDRNVMFPKTFLQEMNISSIMELTSLRVLDAHNTGIKYLPTSISNLKHLRYLNLSVNPIRTLPNSLCSLWNLQTLILDDCYFLEALPKNLRYLRNLRHIYLSNCKWLSQMPSKMRELSHLQTLTTFVVGHNRDNQLEELQCLELRGKLEIRKLERVKHHMDAKKAHIGEKKGLQELSLLWARKKLSKLGQDIDEKVLEALEPHPNLRSLRISGFSGIKFPVWMRNSTLGNIVKIDIRDCKYCKGLPKLGELPHLGSLRLENVGVEYITIDEEEEEEEVGSGKQVKIQFVALKELSLFDLPNLKGLSKQQESKEAFPNLKELKIKRCTSLVLPPLSSLKNLEDLECSSSTLSLFSQLDDLTTLKVTVEEQTTCFPMETLVKFTNLSKFKIKGANDITVPGEGLQTLKKIRNLIIKDCKSLRCIPEGFLGHLTALEALTIDSCPEFVELPDEIKHLPNLEGIRLVNLPKMVRVSEALQHLTSLRRLYLRNLPNINSLPDWLDQLTCLSLSDCPKVASVPAAISNLKELYITYCPKLQRPCKRGSGKGWHKIAHIPRLFIYS